MTPRYCLLLAFVVSFHFSFAQNRTKAITHYIYPEFVEGVVLMKNGRKNEVSINYNAISEEMIFVKGPHKLAIGSTESELIDTVFMEEKKFIRLGGRFVEILHQSNICDLFVEYKCKLDYPGKDVGYGGTSQTAAVDNYSVNYSNGLVYELQLPDNYDTKPYLIYYVKKEGVVNEVTNLRQFMKHFKDKQDLFKDYVKNNNVKFENIEQVVGLVNYLTTT